MAFLVEDGTVVPGANAGITVEFADEYHSDRGNLAWVGSNIEKQQAIVRATGYTEQRFRHRYKGRRRESEQTVSWPRFGAFDSAGYEIEGIPISWKYGIAEYALRALMYGELSPDAPPTVPRQNNAASSSATTTTQITGEIRKKSTQVGSIKTSVEYAAPGSSVVSSQQNLATRESQTNLVNSVHIQEYPAADLWFQELIDSQQPIVVNLEFG